ncbi:probable protein phosphatase 2C 34 isoform X2 [Carica papaya]|uniref:probable protein phosphatase 2C 34 isoform X2 n=1 Tax=Carica papaya TaxID=3649 RepID=UPI000B8CAB73|nr:probable protein phosphatase 2C 34 isoform X2 [Carica papaya]
MGHLSSVFNGLARSFSIRKSKSNNGNGDGREAVEAMAKEAKKNELILRSSGCVNVDGSNNFASIFSKQGNKGANQDCAIVWEEFGCQEDMIFCGIFDGHGPWGHFVAKKVRESMPSFLLCSWQESVSQRWLDPDIDLESDKKHQRFNIWKHSYLKTCALVDQELEQYRKIDSFYSGTTALTIVRQVLGTSSFENQKGELIYIANVGDSRAVLATTSEDGMLESVQLTVDLKPNLPEEAERIIECRGRVFCLEDEPGVHRLWLPDEESPGLAMSRAFGDYCVKGYGLISEPLVTQRHITSRDQFVVLATDGVWDVVSNQEAIEMVSSTPDRARSAKCLVEHAVRAWKRKRRGIAMDDISAVCLFFHPSPVSQQVHPITSPK